MTEAMNEAIAQLEKASRAKPEDLVIRRKLTHALARSGRFREAVESILRAVAIHPEWTQYHYELIAGLTIEGFGAQVRKATNELAQQQPDRAAVWYVLGLSCQALGRKDEAVASYRKGLQKDPSSAVLHTNLGNALKITGDEDACLRCQHEAIRHSPTIAEPHYVLGVLYMKARKYESAKKHFEAFVRLGHPYLENYLQDAQISLDIMAGPPHEAPEEPATRTPYWQCPKCGSVFKKSELGMMAAMVVGTATCGICNAKYSQREVYGGHYDVEIVDEASGTTRQVGKGFGPAKRRS